MTVSSTPAPADFGRVGFVGLGDMGGPMADNLVRAGFDVTVFDQRSAPMAAAQALGARAAGSLAELAGRCGTIGLCVWNDEQVMDVVLGPQGLVTSPAARLTLLVHSTVRPRTVAAIAEAFAPRGWAVLDAPVSGGRAASLAGTLTVMVGGARAAYEQHLPYLQAVGEHLFHVGTEAGVGEVAKLCNNLMALCNAQAVMEALQLARAYAVDEATVRAIARVSTGDSWYVRNWEFVDNLLRTHPQPDVMVKDLREALDAAAGRAVELPLTQAAAAGGPQAYARRLQHLRGHAQPGRQASRAAQQALDEVLAAWNAAGACWDPDAFADVYAEDAVFFGGRPGQNNGRAGVRGYFESYRDVLASARLQLQDHALFELAPDVVLAQGYGCFDLVLADGQPTQSVLRGTLTLVRRQGRWQVLQHHFSEAPVVPPIGV